ncbi:8865_t:CDS:2, partial [Entrophospora sp. SA101]
MSKRPIFNVKLIAIGSILPNLHYGINAIHWWTTRGDIDLTSGAFLYPIRVGWQTAIEINTKRYYTQVLEGNRTDKSRPGFRSYTGNEFSDVEDSSSKAITSLYKQLNPSTNTKYSGPLVLGWEQEINLKASLEGVQFRPFVINVDKFQIYITALGISGKDVNEAGVGYTSSFVGEYKKQRSLFVQFIDQDGFHIDIYQKNILFESFVGLTPVEVWEQTGFMKKINGKALFGLEHKMTLQNLAKQQIPSCDPTFWNNEDIMYQIYNYHLKKRTIANVNWFYFFDTWKNQSTIIELKMALQNFYPTNHVFNVREIAAWRAMLKATGCTEISPFEKEKSNYEFWTRAFDPSNDKNIMKMLYEKSFLNPNPSDVPDVSNEFWYCFQHSLDENKRGYDGKNRTLSTIADRFTYDELQKNLNVSSKTISRARTYAIRTLIDEIDLSQRHLKFGYGKELRIDSLGNSYHVDCIQHCLPYAFGQCSQLHLETCAECKKLENLFATLVTLLPEETVILSENRGEDIVSAAKGICGTSIANIEPNRSSEKKKKTSLPGISNWFEFRWPVEGEYAGYICARSLPNFGKWKYFSPAIIQKQEKPTPTLSDHTIPDSKWIIPMPSNNTSNPSRWSISKIKEEMIKYNLEIDNNSSRVELVALLREAIDNETKMKITETDAINDMNERDVKKRKSESNLSENVGKIDNNNDIIEVDYFVIGWALKENQIYGKKGGGKQIGDKVKEYLQIYFLSGNMDRSQRFSAKDMLEELEERVKLGELTSEELPTIKTIEGWIS